VKSVQLMSTLFDQAVHIFGDVVAQRIQECKQLNSDELWQRHASSE
jgi:D-arabinose 5-phosphate isomerase GutQ